VLVMAKAPVPGQVKTRLGAVVGAVVAAELAAACLLDTLDVCETVFPLRGMRHVALAGELGRAVRSSELREQLEMWTLHSQRGDGFPARLAAAHLDVARAGGVPVVQIGMDTPHLSAGHLAAVAELVGRGNDAVLGPADDGGWWVLAMTDPRYAEALRTVTMSTDRTYVDTRDALSAAGARVVGTSSLRDVDTVRDAGLAAAAAPLTRFARLWTQVVGATGGRTDSCGPCP
jgi:glycosyltransferase A (GT-A) superfamily protein (DUF2064 family)